MKLRRSECQPDADPERSRLAVFADEAGRREAPVPKRDRDITCVERIPDPRLGEQVLAANAGPKIDQRICVLSLRVRIVVSERAIDDDVSPAVYRGHRT